jgi:NAD(P)-dependent dehydrogenase (short-subunit alcohol dehydrogenase family)
MSIRFDDRVVLITGAGGGLGRSYAVLLGALGASVVVNDLGTDPSGEAPGTSAAAESVVDEITAAGGRAVANADDVSTEQGAAACVKRAVNAFGRLDVVVNNAGINPESEFETTSRAMLERVMAVHIGGTWGITQAAWRHFREQGYGRVVITSSGSIYQGFGNRPTYVLAKAALYGLVRDLAVEGAPFGIQTNGLFPGASTRMSSPGRLPMEWTTEVVAPVVAALSHESCPLNGEMIETRGGEVRRLFMARTPGIEVDADQLTPDIVLGRMDEIMAVDGAQPGALVHLRRA